MSMRVDESNVYARRPVICQTCGEEPALPRFVALAREDPELEPYRLCAECFRLIWPALCETLLRTHTETMLATAMQLLGGSPCPIVRADAFLVAQRAREVLGSE